jgi:hypothetical protein
MPILGDRGALALQREQSAPGVLKAANLNLSGNKVLFTDPSYMTGDQVMLALAGGLPFAAGGTSGIAWIHRDSLDYLTFHETAADAINNRNVIAFNSTSWDDITIAQTAPPQKYVADIREWNLDLDCAAIDTTPIGVRFGENVVDTVTGAGSLRFLIERRSNDAIMNALDLLNLLLLTGPGKKIAAQFWLSTDTESGSCELLPGGIYYEANILIVASSVQVTPDALIEGAVNFATTEDVALRIAA